MGLGGFVQRAALLDEDLGVLGQQVLALHARTARLCSHQQRDVAIPKGALRIVGGDHAGQQREGAVVDLHHHAPQRLLRLLVGDLQQLQNDGLLGAEHVSVGDPEQQAVPDLSGGTGDRDAHGGFHWGGLLKSGDSVKRIWRRGSEGGLARVRRKPPSKRLNHIQASSSMSNQSYIFYKIYDIWTRSGDLC